jgi:hypothetical protein
MRSELEKRTNELEGRLNQKDSEETVRKEQTNFVGSCLVLTLMLVILIGVSFLITHSYHLTLWASSIPMALLFMGYIWIIDLKGQQKNSIKNWRLFAIFHRLKILFFFYLA